MAESPLRLSFEDLPQYNRPEFLDTDVAAINSSNTNPLYRGFDAGIGSMIAGNTMDSAIHAEAAGDMELSNRLRERGLRDQAVSAAAGPRVGSMADVNNVSDAMELGLGFMGQAGATMLPTMAVAAATRGRLRAPAVLGTAYNLEANEAIANQYSDPELAATPVEDRLAAARGKGLINAGLESIVPLGMFGKSARAGTVLGRAGKNMLEEGTTEALQEGVGFGAEKYLDPDRELDPMRIADAALAGALGGGGMSLGVDAARVLPNALGDGYSAAKGLLPERGAPGTGPVDLDTGAAADPIDPTGPVDLGPEGDSGAAADPNIIDTLNERFGPKVREYVSDAKEYLGDVADRMNDAIATAKTPSEFIKTVFAPTIVDEAAADLLPDEQDPAVLNAPNIEQALEERGAAKIANASRYAEELLNDDVTPQSVKDRVAAMNGDFTDPANRKYVTQTLVAQRGGEKFGLAVNDMIKVAKELGGDIKEGAGKLKEKLAKGIDDAQERIIKKNLQDISIGEISPLVELLAQKLGKDASQAPSLAQKLLAAANRISPDSRITPETDARLRAISSVVGDDVLDLVTDLSGNDALRGSIARIRAIPSAINDVGKAGANSFLAASITDPDIKNDPNALAQIARVVDEMGLKSGANETVKNRLMGGLTAVFGSADNAKTVVEYYGNIKREAYKLEAESDKVYEDRVGESTGRARELQQPKSNTDTYEGVADAAEFDTFTEKDAPGREYGYRSATAKRPFRKFVGEKLSNGKTRRESIRALADAKSSDNADYDVIDYGDYVATQGQTPEKALSALKADIAKRLKGHIAKDGKKGEDRTQSINELRGELSLIEKIEKEEGPLAALNQYEVLARQERATQDYVASDDDLTAMQTKARAPDVRGMNDKDKKKALADHEASLVRFKRVKGSDLVLSAESMVKTLGLKRQRSGKVDSPTRASTRDDLKDAVASVLAREDIAPDGLLTDLKEVVFGDTRLRVVAKRAEPDVRAAQKDLEADLEQRGKGVPARRKALREALQNIENQLEELGDPTASSFDEKGYFASLESASLDDANNKVTAAERYLAEAKAKLDPIAIRYHGAKKNGKGIPTEVSAAFVAQSARLNYLRDAVSDFKGYASSVNDLFYNIRRELADAEKSGVTAEQPPPSSDRSSGWIADTDAPGDRSYKDTKSEPRSKKTTRYTDAVLAANPELLTVLDPYGDPKDPKWSESAIRQRVFQTYAKVRTTPLKARLEALREKYKAAAKAGADQQELNTLKYIGQQISGVLEWRAKNAADPREVDMSARDEELDAEYASKFGDSKKPEFKNDQEEIDYYYDLLNMTPMSYEDIPSRVRKNIDDANRAAAKQAEFDNVGGVTLKGSSPYLAKDQAKSDRANKFIGRGSPGSSTASYAESWGDRANTGEYAKNDTVFISVNGNRPGAITPPWAEIKKAMLGSATLITDKPVDRARPFNSGERAVAEFLNNNGYVETAPGTWTPKSNRIVKNSFVGAKADPQGAADAAQALDSGMAASVVWRSRGWFRGPDGKMRKEIRSPVLKARLREHTRNLFDGGPEVKISELLQGLPGFEQLAPQMDGYMLDTTDDAMLSAMGSAGQFSPETKTISLSIAGILNTLMLDLVDPEAVMDLADSDSAFRTVLMSGDPVDTLSALKDRGLVTLSQAELQDKMLDTGASIMLHELQHAIQDAEGLEGGGNPTMAIVAKYGDAEAFAKAYKANDFDETSRIIDDAALKLEMSVADPDADLSAVAASLYRDIVGEAEAFDVQARWGLSDAEAKVLKPELMNPSREFLRSVGTTITMAHIRRGLSGKQSEMKPKKGRPRKADSAEIKKIKDEIARIRGKDVKVRINKLFRELGASGEFSMNEDRSGRLIQIATNAANQMGVAWHESLHDFFAMLSEDKVGRSIKKDLIDASNAVHVKKRLAELLKDHPDALKQMEESPEERVAYMYQFWAEGELSLGPTGTRIFQKIKQFFTDLLGVIGAEKRAVDLLTALHEGRFADPSAVAEVLSDMPNDRVMNKLDKALPMLTSAMDKVFTIAPDRLREFQNDSMTELADRFENKLIPNRFQQEGQWTNRLDKIFEGTTATERRAALDNRQAMKDPTTKLEKDLVKFFDDMHNYLEGAGVMTFDSKTKQWVKMRRVENYFPRVFDRAAINKDRDGFIKLLMRHGKLNSKDAHNVVEALTHGTGQLDLAESEHALGYTPYASAVQDRKFTFINQTNAAEFAKFQSKDLADITTGYVKQAVHRAEYAREFGNDGEEIQDLIQSSRIRDPKDLKEISKIVQGLEGTIGNEMSSTTKEIISGVLTLQNLVVLPLSIFSQMIDPVVLAARTGSIKDAGTAYITALKRLTGKKVDGEELAGMLGIISQDSVLDAMGVAYGSAQMSARTRKINRAFFKYNLMQGWNNSMRIAATVAGERYLIANKADEKALSEVGLTPSDVKVDSNGRLKVDNPAVQQAMYKFVDQAVLRPSASSRPVWMSDPRFLLVAHLKQFTFAMHNVVLRRANKQLDSGNLKPWATLAIAMPVILAADMAKFALMGKVPSSWGFMDHIVHAVERSGLLGLGDFAVQSTQGVSTGRAAPGEGLLGPSFEHLMRILRWIGGDPRTGAGDVLERTVPGARFI